MSCGPDQKQKTAIDAVNNSVAITDQAAGALAKGVASIPGYASVQLLTQINKDLKLLKELVNDPLAIAEAAIPSLPTEFAQYIAAGNALAGDSVEFLKLVDDLNDKYGDFDYGDPEDILQAINEVGGDINRLCEAVPNVQKRKGEFIKKGNPVSGKTDQIANPVKHHKLKSIGLVKDYVDGFNADKSQANKKEVDVTKAETQRHLMSE